MRTLRVTILGALAAAACMGGCGVLRAPLNPGTWPYRQQTDDPIYLRAEEPVAVDVESFNGDVIVNASERFKWATVRVRRQATHGYGRSVDAGASLAGIDYRIGMVPGEAGEVLTVRIWTTDPEPWFQRAHVEIDVPAVDGLRVRTQRGKVYATNIRGAVDVEIADGDVRIITNRPMWQPVSVTTLQGDVDYRVRGESTAAFDCEAANGDVTYRVRYGRLHVLPGTNNTRLLASLNGGDNPVHLRAANGDIRIAVVSEPTQIGATIIDP